MIVAVNELAGYRGGLTPSPTSVAPTIRIVIIDDHPIFRDGLRRLLETATNLRVVADDSTRNAGALLKQLTGADILLLGLSPSGESSLWALERLTTADGRPLRTILLTRSVDAPEVFKALRFAPWGIIAKDTTADALFKSIESVMGGRCWVGGEPVAQVLNAVRRLDDARRRIKAFGLTRRELEIVRRVMGGDTNKEIAERVSISENTVKCHLTHIFNKVGVSTRVELGLFAAHHQVLGSS